MIEKAEEKDLKKAIGDAVGLHGHLGPFLVIGVRMGKVAQKILGRSTSSEAKFRITMKVPQTTPFSCTIDGIQSTTHCTIGNQRLKVEKSEEEICGSFKVQRPRRTLRIHVRPSVIGELIKRIGEGVSNERLAARVASMSDSELFTIEKI